MSSSFNPYEIPTLAPTQPYRPRPDHVPPEHQTQQQPPPSPSHSPRSTYQTYNSTMEQSQSDLFSSMYLSASPEQPTYGFSTTPYDSSQQLYQQSRIAQHQQQQSYVSYGPYNPAEHVAPPPDLYKRYPSASDLNPSPRINSATSDSSLKGYADMLPPPIPIRITSQEKQLQRDFIERGQKEARELRQLTDNPIYGTYGSSAISLSPPTKPLRHPNPAQMSPSSAAPPGDFFDPRKVGAPLPPSDPANFAGLYSSSGVDLLAILARVTNRKNPEIQLGPIDLGCSFTVTDPRQPDNPIIYASDTFSALTGYTNAEILGRNCRFLQSPDGEVEKGAKRAYTDGNAVHHLKKFLTTGRESQASLINYRKGGEPFINLVTCVPISWDDNPDEIAYFVGFQVNLVEMPNSIMNKMANGTYVVNYSLVGKDLPQSTHSLVDSMEVSEEHWTHSTPQDNAEPEARSAFHPEAISEVASGALVDAVQAGLHSLRDEKTLESFSKLLLDHCEDLVHVVSLKGILNYVSPSVCKLLEYSSAELVGKPLSSICHPADIVAVLRELKEASHGDEGVNLLYRVRRKHSGYIWLASHGKLFVDPGRSRKSIILTGRQEKVYNVSWADLERAGGLTDQEYWVKYSLDGMHLYSTPSVEEVLGYTSNELMGSTIAHLDDSGELMAAIRRVAAAPTPVCTSLNHTLKGKFGPIHVTTNFYPSHAFTNESKSAGIEKLENETSNHIIAQTTKSNMMAMRRGGMMPAFSRTTSIASGSPTDSGSSSSTTPAPVALPSYRERLSDEDGAGSSGSSSGRSSTSSFSAIPSTFKTLTTSASDNIFVELETTRGTSWQFELHQLKLVNRKLREEKAALATLIARKKKKRPPTTNPSLAPSDSTSPVTSTGKAKDDKGRTCANCGRTATSEWRSGPTGPKTLCNACGLRWSKARSMSATSQSGAASSVSMSSGSSSDQLPMYHSSDSRLHSPFSSQSSIQSSLSPAPMPQKAAQLPLPHQHKPPQRPSLADTHGHYISYASSSGHSGDISSSGTDSFGNLFS